MCSNVFATYNCTCNEGFDGDGLYTCTDIDECIDETHTCSTDATCNNTIGAYECFCDDGLFGDGYNCTDSNECGDVNITNFVGLVDPIYDTHTCHNDATCVNVYADFNCTCNEGYDGDGFNCTDIDECTDNSHMCHADAACNNTIGS